MTLSIIAVATLLFAEPIYVPPGMYMSFEYPDVSSQQQLDVYYNACEGPGGDIYLPGIVSGYFDSHQDGSNWHCACILEPESK